MQESNGQQGPSIEPSGRDFGQDLRNAQMSGDYEFVLDTAKKSHAMLVEFMNAIKQAMYAGREAAAIAQGINFLANMIAQSASQIDGLRRAEKQARDQIKMALKAKQSPQMEVVGPELPEQLAGEPGPEQPPKPETPEPTPGTGEVAGA